MSSNQPSDDREVVNGSSLVPNGNTTSNAEPNVQQPAATPVSAPETSSLSSISADEIALYDRQIRLWGVGAQEKIRTSNILLITAKGLGNEVAKNLVLAGVGSLTIQDHGLVTDDDLGAQFLISESNIGQNRAQAVLPALKKMNPRVVLNALTGDIRLVDQTFFLPYNIVIVTDLDLPSFSTINAACRLVSKPLYAAGTHGMYGYIFSDLISHDFVIEREKSNRETNIGPETTTRSVVATSTKKQDGKTLEMVRKREIYSPIILANTSPLPKDQVSSRRRKLQIPPLLSCLRALWEFQGLNDRMPAANRTDIALYTSLATEKHRELQLPSETLKAEFLRSFLQNLGSEIAPVTAFLGGQLAQDVINVIGQREQPIQNLLLFDGEESKGPIYSLHPIFEGDSGLDPTLATPIALPPPPAVVPMPAMVPMTANGSALV